MIYLDNAATTAVCPEAKNAVLNAMVKDFGNPSSLYGLGLTAENIMSESANTIAGILNCSPKEILFTSGATESNNLALLGAARANKRNGNKIIVSEIEHPSVHETAKALESEGFEVLFIPPRSKSGLCAEDFINAADDKTILVSCMLVNNEIGAVSPVSEIAAGVRRKNPKTIIHSDAVQAFCKIPINLKRLGVDLLSVSGHKIYAPKGIGALYIKDKTKIKPLLFGGGQQRNLRVGTEPVELIAGFAAAADVCFRRMAKNAEHYAVLKREFIEKTQDIAQIALNSTDDCAPYIVNFSVDSLKSEVLLHFLEQKEIYVSSGSACSKGKKSRVLKAFGFSDRAADCALRISFCPDSSKEDIGALVNRIKLGLSTLARLR